MSFGLSAGAIGLIGAVAGPVIGGMMGSDAAESGYEAQAEGARLSDATQREIARMSDATQRYMYDTTRADNSRFLGNGISASDRLAVLMGLEGTSGSAVGGAPAGGVGAAPGLTREQIRQQLLGQFTTTTGGSVDRSKFTNNLIYGDGDIIGADAGTGDSTVANYGGNTGRVRYWDDQTNSAWAVPQSMMTSATSIDEAGLNAAIDAQMAQQGQQQSLQTQQPAKSNSSDPNFGALTRKFSLADLAGDVVYQNGLQFGLDEGRKGIQRQQQATGSLLSGATLKALSRLGNDYATTKTEGAYNRFTQDNTNYYNRLAGIAGSGQTAAAQVGNAGQNYANSSTAINTNMGNSLAATAQGLGTARAASGIASANSIGGGLQGAYNNYQGTQLLKQLQGPSWKTPGFNTGSEPYPGYNSSVGLG